MDFQEAVLSAFEKIVAGGVIEAAIEKQLTATIQQITNELLTKYSEFGKQLQATVAQSLQFSGELDLPSYNDAILKIIRLQVASLTEATIQKQVAAQMEDLLTPPPESITLSDLVAQYIKHVKSKREYGVGFGYEEITLRVETSGGVVVGFKDIALSATKGVKKYDCDIRIGCTNDGEVYHLSFKDKDVENRLFAGPFYGFERMLFQMRVAKSRIVFDVDPDEIDTSYCMESDEDE